MRRVRRFDADGAVCLWWAIERRSLSRWARVQAVQKLNAAIGRFVDDDRAMSLAVFTKNFPKRELDGLQTFSLALDALASDSIISTSTKTFRPLGIIRASAVEPGARRRSTSALQWSFCFWRCSPRPWRGIRSQARRGDGRLTRCVGNTGHLARSGGGDRARGQCCYSRVDGHVEERGGRCRRR